MDEEHLGEGVMIGDVQGGGEEVVEVGVVTNLDDYTCSCAVFDDELWCEHLDEEIDKLGLDEETVYKDWETKVLGNTLADEEGVVAGADIILPARPDGCVCNGPPTGKYRDHVVSCPNYVPIPAGECNCGAVKYNNVHTFSCPADKKANDRKKWARKCEHERDEFKLLDDTLVRVSAWADVKYVQDERVDVGVYLAGGWQQGAALVTPGLEVPWGQDPMTKGVYVDWPDMGVPKNMDLLMSIAQWVLDESKKGVRFEVGCQGGHGRTGTFLALLLILQGATPPDAVAYVRKEHCDRAVESASQLSWLAGAYRLENGNESWKQNKAQKELWSSLAPAKPSWKNSSALPGSTTSATITAFLKGGESK